MEEASAYDDEIQKSSDFMSESDEEDDTKNEECFVSESQSVQKISNESQEDVALGSSCMGLERETMTSSSPDVTSSRNNSSGSGYEIRYFEPLYSLKRSSVDAIVPVMICQGKQRTIMLLKFHLDQSLVVEIIFYMLFPEWLYFPFQIASIRINLQEYFIQNGLAETNGLEFEYDENSKAVFRQKQDSLSNAEYIYNCATEDIKLPMSCSKFQNIEKGEHFSRHQERFLNFSSKPSWNDVPMIPAKMHLETRTQCSVDRNLASKFLSTTLKNCALSYNFDPSALNTQRESDVYMVLFPHPSTGQTHQVDDFVETQKCASHAEERDGNCEKPEEFNTKENFETESSNVRVSLRNDTNENLENADNKSRSLLFDVPTQGNLPFPRHEILCRSSFANPILNQGEDECKDVEALIPERGSTLSTSLEKNEGNTLTKKSNEDRQIPSTLNFRKGLHEIGIEKYSNMDKDNPKNLMLEPIDKCSNELEVFGFSLEPERSSDIEENFVRENDLCEQIDESSPAKRKNSDEPSSVSNKPSLRINHEMATSSKCVSNFPCSEDICIDEIHTENINFEKIVNTSAYGNAVVKIPKKILLDFNQAIWTPFTNERMVTSGTNEKLQKFVWSLLQLNPRALSLLRYWVEIFKLKEDTFLISVFGNRFANQYLIRLCLNDDRDRKAISEDVRITSYHNSFQSRPAEKIQELNNRHQQSKITYLLFKNVQMPLSSELHGKVLPFENAVRTKVKKFQQKKKRTKTKQFRTPQSKPNANSEVKPEDDTSEEYSESMLSKDVIKLSSKRQWVRHESHSELNNSFEISPRDNLALSSNSVDISEEQYDELVPQEIKRSQSSSDVLQWDSAYGTQSKRTSDGMNEYYESVVNSSEQNYRDYLTEQIGDKSAIRCTEEPGVHTFSSRQESPLEHRHCGIESDNSRNVLQIDPLLAKELVTSGLPLDAVTLKLNSGQIRAQTGSKEYESKGTPRGLVIELAMQAKFTKLDDEFKEIHQSSSGGTSERSHIGNRPTTHLITVDSGCYEKLADARNALDSQGLLLPPYTWSVIAAAATYLMDFLTYMKNDKLGHHCGLVFKNEEIQRIVNSKKKFRIGHEYTILQELGTGGHGSAYLCTCISNGKRSGKPFVVKKILRSLFHEEEITVPFHHGNVHTRMLDVYGIVVEKNEVLVLMQYAGGGTLKQHRTSHERNLEYLIAAFYRILKNLSEVHHLGIVHFDIKEENIVFTSRGDPSSATLLDWGSAKIINQTNQKYGNGTKRFYPPEMLKERKENELDLKKHDVWTLACAFLSNVNDSFVFDKLWKRCVKRQQMYKESLLGRYVINEELLKGKHPPSHLLLLLTDLLMWMLDPDVTSRASISDALSHPVFHCCIYEGTAMNDPSGLLFKESTGSKDTCNRRLVRVIVHYNHRLVYIDRLPRGYPVKDLVRDQEFRAKVEFHIPVHQRLNGYCLLKDNRKVSQIDNDCFLELRPN